LKILFTCMAYSNPFIEGKCYVQRFLFFTNTLQCVSQLPIIIAI